MKRKLKTEESWKGCSVKIVGKTGMRGGGRASKEKKQSTTTTTTTTTKSKVQQQSAS